jgi:hypothetical protein
LLLASAHERLKDLAIIQFARPQSSGAVPLDLANDEFARTSEIGR